MASSGNLNTGRICILCSSLAFSPFARSYAFNRSTHEKDLFAASEVERRVRKWRRLVLERRMLAPA